MANKTPLLSDTLTETQRLNLTGLRHHPGFSVLELMFMEACKRATEDVIKLDPIEEGYERKLKALQSKARDRSEFSLLVLQSIDWQTAMAEASQTQDTKAEPEVNRIVKPLVTRTE
jgi:hypothetical protein